MTAHGVVLRSIRHPLRLTAFLGIIILLLIAAFLLGSIMVSPEDRALHNADDTVPVLAQVETRVVGEDERLPGTVSAGQSFSLKLTAGPAEGSGPTVISGVRVAPGDTLAPGSIPLEISGRPRITVPPEVPLYRDVLEGDRGNDVRALQLLLRDLGARGVRVTGVADRATLDAIGHIYVRAGYSAPVTAEGAAVILWSEFIHIPAGGAVLKSISPVGTVLSGESEVLSLRLSPDIISTRVTARQLARYPVGTPVRISAGTGEPAESSVIAVGEFNTDSSGAGGYDITLSLPPQLGLGVDAAVQILPAAVTAETPAVPLTAVRQDGGKSYVELAPAEGAKATPSPRRIEIRITAQGGGWAAIEPREDLPVGTSIRVGP
ncbi:hypothetical protein [Mycetocola spongiae]|uniref:hypothetical protein n=1 Tax=Mycetocola spongiae TaxID=2859226 RepID=UPI001CF53357|nr:hypothetical protein [Mycetocola spongiae]UCR89714.1 hypothetical protein KXZ72_03290 [Mycetocola spongiae]